MNPLHLFYITNIRIMQDITNGRCGWCGTDELYVKYHDQEWGKLVTDDKTLFEFLVLESAQAGLSWITILRKREGYRKAFYNFDAELVAQMTDEDIERLMQFEGIVKNRLKIKSTITNAKLFLAVQKEFGSFYNYTLSFFPDKKPIINTFRSLSEIPVSSPEQELIDDPEVNAIYIATPPSSHATYAIMAMKAGKPAYIEKPMAVTYEECTRINRISKETGVPCFVAYYRRYLPYFQKVKEMVENGSIGNVINVQVRFAQPPRDLDYNRENLPWRVQADIAGGGYFYDLAPHQIDLLQDMFGCILEASGYKSNRGGLYPAEDTLSACFQFDNGLVGSGSWCFVAHDSAREDRIEIIGDKGMICFSVFTYEPIGLHTERGREEICIGNPEHVQQPLIQAVVDHLLGKSVCSCDGESATLTNWVMDKILGKL